MRQFGSEMTSWSDTHSPLSDEAESIKSRWVSLNQQIENIDRISNDQWDAYVQRIDRDFANLKGDYQRASSKHQTR